MMVVVVVEAFRLLKIKYCKLGLSAGLTFFFYSMFNSPCFYYFFFLLICRKFPVFSSLCDETVHLTNFMSRE